jgi:hypothetical protein
MFFSASDGKQCFFSTNDAMILSDGKQCFFSTNDAMILRQRRYFFAIWSG